MFEDIERRNLFKYKNEFIQTAVELLKGSIDFKYYKLTEGGNIINKIMKFF